MSMRCQPDDRLMTAPLQGIGRKMAKGAAWMVGFKLVERSIGMISTIILARLLIPEDFGLIAMATAVIAVVELLQAFSFDVALIQNQQATREDYDTAWTLNMLLAAGCALLLAALAYPMSAFYGDHRVESVIYCLAAGFLVQGFENIGIIAFRKELTLHKEFWFLLAKKLVAFTITVSFALLMRNYWALVIGIVSSRVIGVALSYLVHPYRPRLSFARVSALVNFSKWLLISNALFTARSRAADIIVGRVAGAYALGLYGISYEISNLPTTELSAPINRAVFPGYSVLSQNVEALREGVRKVMSLIVLVTVPAALGIAAVAEPLVLTLLGAKWAGTVPLIRVLAFFGLATSLQTNLGYVFLAKGRARFITIWSATLLLLQLPLVIFGALHYGIFGAAVGMLGSAVIPMPFVFLSLSRLIGLTLRDWFSITWRPVLSTTIMGLVLMIWLSFVSPVTGSGGSSLLILVSSVSLGAVTYSLCIVTLWVLARKPTGPEAYLFDRVLALIRPPST